MDAKGYPNSHRIILSEKQETATATSLYSVAIKATFKPYDLFLFSQTAASQLVRLSFRTYVSYIATNLPVVTPEIVQNKSKRKKVWSLVIKMVLCNQWYNI
jgi:hypothetical protein